MVKEVLNLNTVYMDILSVPDGLSDISFFLMVACLHLHTTMCVT